MNRHCGTCQHHIEIPNPQQIGKGSMFCRRFPPQVVSTGRGELTATFPPVSDEMTCWEWCPMGAVSGGPGGN